MEIRFYIDPETGRPHVESHGVTTAEAIESIERATQDFAGHVGARVAIGPTIAGRILKVIYRLQEMETVVFIITAYSIQGNELRAYRRRMRRRGTR